MERPAWSARRRCRSSQPLCGATLLGLPLAGTSHRRHCSPGGLEKTGWRRARVWWRVRDTTAATQCLLSRGGLHSPNGSGGHPARRAERRALLLGLEPAGSSPRKSPGIGA